VNLWSSRMRLYQKHYSPLKRMLAGWIVRQGMQRKIRLAQADATLSDSDRAALINAYRKVIELFSGSRTNPAQENSGV
jgi:hypothetical protein